MRAYLSSFRLGTAPGHLVRLAGAGARIAVIANAIDGEAESVRLERTSAELSALSALGLDPVEIDLRAYFEGRTTELAARLSCCQALWLRGGNVFVLRHALAASGADALLVDLIAADLLVYAGYSAGPCVLGPDLDGLETVDDATAVNRVYGSEPRWSGLGLVNFRIVPHAHSPTSPESAVLDALAERYSVEGLPHITLRDGEALVIDGDSNNIVGTPATVDELLY